MNVDAENLQVRADASCRLVGTGISPPRELDCYSSISRLGLNQRRGLTEEVERMDVDGVENKSLIRGLANVKKGVRCHTALAEEHRG